MIRMKDNWGLTLVELIISIAVGSIVTLATVTVFIMGLRVHHRSTDTALLQNEIQIGITAVEKMLAENACSSAASGEGVTAILDADGNTLLLYNAEEKMISTGAGMQLLEEVTAFSVDDQLISFTVAEQYSASVYCRRMQIESTEDAVSEGASPLSLREEPTDILAQAMADPANGPGVRAFLGTLASQLGSTGRILTEDGQGQYYSEWYIGSYADNPTWNADTPWCACFVSWALEECTGYLQGAAPKFANVDDFWAEFVLKDSWRTDAPEAGDVIFFDWIVDGEPNPQHVGVVLARQDGWVYTIEGNTDGRVALRKYAADDSRILCYGILNWN